MELPALLLHISKVIKGKNAKNFMFYMPHWHFFELEKEKIPSFRASKIQRILCPKKVPKGAARAAAVAWALIMCPTTWTLLKFQPSLVALAPIIG